MSDDDVTLRDHDGFVMSALAANGDRQRTFFDAMHGIHPDPIEPAPESQEFDGGPRETPPAETDPHADHARFVHDLLGPRDIGV
jgi:hypothetical protein